MKRKFVAVLLSVLLVSSLCGTTALAASSTFYNGSETGTITATFSGYYTTKSTMTYSNSGPTLTVVNEQEWYVSSSDYSISDSKSNTGKSSVSKSYSNSSHYCAIRSKGYAKIGGHTYDTVETTRSAY